MDKLGPVLLVFLRFFILKMSKKAHKNAIVATVFMKADAQCAATLKKIAASFVGFFLPVMRF